MVLSPHPLFVPWVALSLHPLRCILEVLVKGIMVLHVLMPQMVLSLHPLRRILDFLVKNGIPLRFSMPQMVLSLHLLRRPLGALYLLRIGLFPVLRHFKPVALCLWALTL